MFCLFWSLVPDQNTSTTWRGRTCQWWPRAKAGQNSPGLWICGKRRLGGCRRLSWAQWRKGWHWRIPPSERSSLRPPQSLNKRTTGSFTQGHKELVVRGCCVWSQVWLTEAHEGESSCQHDSGLSSIGVDDCSQTTWDTTYNTYCTSIQKKQQTALLWLSSYNTLMRGF